MSLRDFIRATTKEFQDANAKKTLTAEQPPPITAGPSVANAESDVIETEKSG